MLKIEVPTGTEFALSAMRLPDPFGNVPQYGSCFSRNNRDPVNSFIRDSLSAPRARSLNRILGYPSSTSDSTLEVRGDPPLSLRYSSFLDHTWYDSLLGSYADILYGRAYPDREGMRHEKGVIHPKYLGHATVSDSSLPELYSVSGSRSTHGLTLDDCLITSATWRLVNRITQVSDVSTGVLRHLSVSASSFLTTLCDRIKASVGPIYVIQLGNKKNWWKIEQFSSVFTSEDRKDKVSLAYTLWWRSWNANVDYSSNRWQDWTYSVTTDLTVDEVTPYTGIKPGSGTFFIDGLSLTSRSTWSLSKGEKGHSSVNDTWGNGASISSGSGSTKVDPVTRDYGTVLHLPSIASLSPEILVEPQCGIAQTRGVLNNLHARFAESIQRDTYDWLVSHFYSSADAINGFFEIVKAEHLETLAELGDIASLLPDVAQFLRLLTDVKSLRLLQAGKRIIDLWADLQLKWSFGVAPNIDSIVEISEKYERIKARFDGKDIWGARTLHGKVIKDLPSGTFGRDRVTLVGRSKIRVHLEDNSLLLTFLRGKAIGLVPSLSQAWNLLPFSFGIDWFVPIGGKLKNIDDRMSMLLVPTLWCVHSVTMYSDLSDDEMEQLQISPYGSGNHPQTVYHERTVSRQLPPLRDSDIVPEGQTGIPNYEVAGALMYSMST